MIQVGINENVVLEKVEITEPAKGTLATTWKTITTDEPVDPMAALGGDGYAETGGNELSIRIFPPLPPFDKSTDGTPIAIAEQQKAAANSIGEIKNTLFQILSTYMTSDKIKFDVYKGTGVTLENFGAKIVQKAVLEQIMANLAADFVRMITPFVGKPEFPVRLLLVRQSKTKHFATFRQKFVKDYPFIEPMSVPAEASKLKFSKFEISNKLNEGTILDKAEADIKEELATQQDIDYVFNQAS